MIYDQLSHSFTVAAKGPTCLRFSIMSDGCGRRTQTNWFHFNFIVSNTLSTLDAFQVKAKKNRVVHDDPTYKVRIIPSIMKSCHDIYLFPRGRSQQCQ